MVNLVDELAKQDIYFLWHLEASKLLKERNKVKLKPRWLKYFMKLCDSSLVKKNQN